MKTGTSRRGAPSALLWGALIILGWALLSILGSTGEAHADDGLGDDSGLLTIVGDTVRAASDGVGDTVEAAAKPVMETVTKPVAQVVKTVTENAVVGQPAAETVKAVSDGVRETAAPVVEAVRETSVSEVLQPVTDLVTETPIVGDALDDLGVLELIDHSAGAVDTVAEQVVDGADGVIDAVPPALGIPEIQAPIAETPVGGDGVQNSATVNAVASAASVARAGHLLADAGVASGVGEVSPVSNATAGAAASDDRGEPRHSPADPGPPGAPTASVGPAGSSTAAQATAGSSPAPPADDPTVRGPSAGSSLPPSPAETLDVTPD